MMPPDAAIVPSPCRQVCTLDASRTCIGCGRTADEVQEWLRASGERRLAIRAAARARLEARWQAEQERGPA